MCEHSEEKLDTRVGTALFRSLIHLYSTIFDKFMIQGLEK